MRYTATIEAKGYGQAEDEGASLMGALPEESDDLAVNVGVDENRDMLRTELSFDAEDAMDAQEQAMLIWRQAWETAFPDMGPTTQLAITAVPGAPEQLVSSASDEGDAA